jgi:hypothetical protein
MIWIIVALPLVVILAMVVVSFFVQDINKIALRGALAGIVALIPNSLIARTELPNSFISVDLPFFKFTNASANITIGTDASNVWLLVAVAVALTLIALGGLWANSLKPA